MAIIQISKIQVRSGDLVDLPQLDEGEFGWASDSKKLYIGKTTPNENIEILTSYSQINFSALTGSYGNLNITTPTTGQVLAYDATSNTWINAGGNVTNTINLGDASSLKILGGAIGYVLETDGTGNLSWTPKGTISANIDDATQTNPVVITTVADNFFTDGSEVTITNVSGMTELNGNSYYANIISSNSFALYSDSGLSTPVNGNAFGAYTGNGRAVASVGGGSGGGTAGGSTYSIQYNAGGISSGDANFQWNYGTQALSITGTASISGNANVGNIGTAGQIISTIATGTAPLTVTSTTRVANLDVAKSGVANTVNDAAQPNITSVGTLTSVSVSGNANIGNIGTAGLITATGNIGGGNINTGGLITATGNITGGNLVTGGALSVTGNANIGNIGTGGLITATGNIGGGNINTGGVLSVTGNANIGNIGTAGLITATGNIRGANLVTGGVLSVTGNANVGNIGAAAGVFTTVAGTLTTAAQPNITSTGTLAGIVVSGSITPNANITYDLGNNTNRFKDIYLANSTIYLGSQTISANATTVSISGNISGNITGNISGNATSAGTVTTAAQPNITSTGTLVSLSVSGNANIGNIGTGGLITATGNIQSSAFLVGANLSITGNANVGNLGTAGIVSATGNLQGGNLVLANAAIITVGANTNVGTITGNWTLSTGSRLQATYADLAEYYEADEHYEPGTVLEFGGDKEVTIAQDGTTKVAGVVSTNPAYAMNAKCPGIAVAIALQGRVPTKVRGAVRKGDMMVSAGNGFARPWNNPQMGTVIGKALENFDGIEGVIEIAVGRL